MPKREPTPPPPDDEPWYFTVLSPYPPNANMELPGDMVQLAQWLSAATGDSNALMALFHKPSSPRLIILEVSRSYKDVRRLLGQHFWGGPKGFLNRPLTAANYSAIFFCCYTTARQVEKHGWKRKWFEPRMFPSRAELDKIFKNPYPATTYLQVPSMDPTALEFCRHLPLSLFPEVVSNKIEASEAPVGSEDWAVKKEQGPPAANQKQTISPKTADSTSFVPAIDAAPPPVDIAQDAQEPQDLWAASNGHASIKLMSDLAIASQVGESDVDQHICPWHGNCNKMCEWRTNHDKKYPPKSEGPSNTKNYNRTAREGNNVRGKPRLNIARSEGSGSIKSLSPESGNMSPIAASPSTAGKGTSTVKRAPPAPPGLNRPIAASPIDQNAPEISPSSALAVSPGAGRGIPTGPVRGAPAWSSRGRGRGRAV